MVVGKKNPANPLYLHHQHPPVWLTQSKPPNQLRFPHPAPCIHPLVEAARCCLLPMPTTTRTPCRLYVECFRFLLFVAASVVVIIMIVIGSTGVISTSRIIAQGTPAKLVATK
jgi:hypothetical protein